MENTYENILENDVKMLTLFSLFYMDKSIEPRLTLPDKLLIDSKNINVENYGKLIISRQTVEVPSYMFSEEKPNIDKKIDIQYFCTGQYASAHMQSIVIFNKDKIIYFIEPYYATYPGLEIKKLKKDIDNDCEYKIIPFSLNQSNDYFCSMYSYYIGHLLFHNLYQVKNHEDFFKHVLITAVSRDRYRFCKTYFNDFYNKFIVNCEKNCYFYSLKLEDKVDFLKNSIQVDRVGRYYNSITKTPDYWYLFYTTIDSLFNCMYFFYLKLNNYSIKILESKTTYTTKYDTEKLSSYISDDKLYKNAVSMNYVNIAFIIDYRRTGMYKEVIKLLNCKTKFDDYGQTLNLKTKISERERNIRASQDNAISSGDVKLLYISNETVKSSEPIIDEHDFYESLSRMTQQERVLMNMFA